MERVGTGKAFQLHCHLQQHGSRLQAIGPQRKAFMALEFAIA